MISGYHSTTEYHFCDEQADAICRTAAYHRKDYSLALIWFSAREHTDIRRSIATPFRTTADTGLGSLNRLPLELWYDVLFRLDMQSLFKLRQTSLRSREWIDSLHQYQMVVSHGLNLFCALLRTRLADSVSLADFYNILGVWLDKMPRTIVGRVLTPFLANRVTFSVGTQAIWALDKFHFLVAGILDMRRNSMPSLACRSSLEYRRRALRRFIFGETPTPHSMQIPSFVLWCLTVARYTANGLKRSSAPRR